MIGADFFRSLSLVEDLEYPDRFGHYRPTRRALPIITAIVEPASTTMVIAPYGSGKSLAAGVGALAVRNSADDRRALMAVLERTDQVDPAVSGALRSRASAPLQGHVVILSGMIDDPIAAIAEALGMTRPPKSVEGFGKAMRDGGWDHVAIIWDEFGRHLEGLVADGRSSELDVVQRLAERVARASGPTMSLTLLLHQNLLAYATRLNDTSRSEWRKIEGRFRPLRMIEDSQEFYRLIADVVSEMRPPESVVIMPRVDQALADEVVKWKWLDGIEDGGQALGILDDVRPLTAGALQILPTLVARVGQNERSLFSFLREIDLTRKVDIEVVYTSFSDAMRTDVGIGGIYRRWIETESARSRADTPLQRMLLAAACLLQLGTSGERRRLPRNVLELAVAETELPAKEIAAAVDELLEAKLLLWRKHTDDVAVWHGADIDVAIRVREERERRSSAFDLRAFLEDRFPAPHIRAPRHNAEFGVNRFLMGRYASVIELAELLEDGDPASGAIVYVLAESKGDIAAARKLAKKSSVHAIIAIPDRPLAAESAAIELISIEALRADKEFVASDPMVTTEIDELQSVAFEELATLLRGVLDPRATGATWYSQGERLDVSPERPGPMAASRLLSQWFDKTPKIANDQLMRNTASRTMQTARVRVVGSILERSGRERLGYEEGDRGAEGSIYRTVIENTGLRPKGSTRFADPDQITDPGFKEVWLRIADFFRTPTGRSGGAYRDLSAFVSTLASAPMGVPLAVMPLLIAAGFKHFSRAMALYDNGRYVADTLGFQFDNMVTNPEGFCVQVLDPTPDLVEYLSEAAYVFSHERPTTSDELVRFAHDALTRWLLTVPDGSRRSQKLGTHAKGLLRTAGGSSDPVQLLLKDLPLALGAKGPSPSLIAKLESARKEIDHLRDQFAQDAVEVIAESFRSADLDVDPLEAVTAWAGCFDAASLDRRDDLRIVDRAVLRKAVETVNGRFSPKSLANTLSSILLQRSLDKWDDRTAAQFRSALRDARERIEAAALDTESPTAALRPIVQARVEELTRMLVKIDETEDSRIRGLQVAGGKR
ncbi:hypothetical protein [Sphingobium sp. YR768]|uniref:hypothetical protein n=1 Tax=Sphingobium sp. YR768 TaxID=1884365 RepID=UPI0008BECC17|nr:hypothetical protein [Sphingobium sp. YR768]SER82478.1 hypothetical protein SAMN05518866_12043 [Sphingobium sp. YR768]